MHCGAAFTDLCSFAEHTSVSTLPVVACFAFSRRPRVAPIGCILIVGNESCGRDYDGLGGLFLTQIPFGCQLK